MRNDLAGLNAILAVAEKRSFTAASAELRVTPSAISQSIRALEDRVGVRLVQRTTHKVGLTEAGERFVAQLRPGLDQVEQAFACIEDMRDRPSGLLRLSMPRFAFSYVIQPRLAAFLAKYPEIRLDVWVDDARVDIVEAGFDAGIHLGETIAREMIAVRVSDDQRMAVVASPAYFATHGKPKHPRDLRTHDCINYRRSPADSVYRWEFTENGRDFEIAVEGRIQVSDRELMVVAALDGLGIAYVAESRVAEHLSAKRLVRVLAGWSPPFPGLFLYYPSRANIAPKLRALVDFLRPTPRKQAPRS
ncbi:Transcriptional regulator, LysR family [Labilithrix luteola]|uniref:Transcriptional regulator, LysR family n=1 Tax=Labilithrix luteola TaxID=1391654 RepID=A0A0K1PQB7_9BACT|nr:LysR family transcriptional regulator [Labilithrix luteola]AKU95713.1 Transcriptional regulator, LysR family [Labilithrix luteola]